MSDGVIRLPRPARTDLKEAGLGQRDALLQIADDAQFWRTPAGDTYGSIPVGGHTEHCLLASRSFRDWLLGEMAKRYSVNGRPASVGDNALHEARLALEARAYVDGVVHEAPLRVAEHDGTVYIDLGTDAWSVIEIHDGEWEEVALAPIPIVRSRRTGAMVVPAPEADFRPLRKVLRRLSDSDYILFLAWCLGALAPHGPYPILILTGEAGGGKSTLIRLAQRLVDPVVGDLLQPPGNDGDLIAAAKSGRMLPFDNLSRVSSDLADSLCRLATGAEIGGRQLYTDNDSASFAACRLLALNGIPDLASRGDLADRSIVIRLGPLDGRMTERDFWVEVEAALPPALTGLLNAFAVGLARLAEVPTPNVRMADFARLVMAAEPMLPWGPAAFLAAYVGNRRNAIAATIEGDIVGGRILALMASRSQWEGLMSELYDMLSTEISPEAKRSGGWPGNTRWFSDRLTRAAPALRSLGINVTSRHGERGTSLTIQKIASVASSPQNATEPADHTDATDAIPPLSGQPLTGADDATDAIPPVSGQHLTDDDVAYIEEIGR